MIISDLYQTNITCSTYNTTIDSGNGSTTITVTVKLEDFNKNAVSGKSVTLTVDKGYFKSVTGTSTTNYSNTTTKSVSATTKSDGTITAVYVPSEEGLATFTANNTKIQILVGKANSSHSHSWTSQACTEYGTLYINSALRLCELSYYRTNYTFADSGVDYTLHSGSIPSAYRPKMNKAVTCVNQNIRGVFSPDGHIQVQASAKGTKTINMSAMWHY